MAAIKTIKENFISKIREGNSISFTNFDLRGNKIRFEDGSFIEKWEYDSDDNLLNFENPAYYENYWYNQNEISYYNSKGLKWIKIVDVQGNEVMYKEVKNLAWKLKFLNRFINLGKRHGLKWSKEYNDKNLEIYYQDNRNEKIWKSYDSHNNLIKRTNKKDLFDSFLYEYDERGNVIKYKDSKGKKWSRKYDINDNLLEQRENGELKKYFYENGLLIKTEHHNGRTNSYEYDEKRRVTQRLDNNGYREITSYDANDNIIKIDNDVCIRNFEINYW